MIKSQKLLGPEWIFILGAVCLLVRLPLWMTYQGLATPDSSGYEAVAQQLATFNFQSYLGARPPVYPLILVIFGSSFQRIWIFQSLIGILTSLLLYQIALTLTKNYRVAFSVGLSVSLCLNLLFFEALMMPETVSICFVILAVWLLVRMESVVQNSLLRYAIIGSVLSLATLAKPYLGFLIPMYVVFFALRWRKQHIAYRGWGNRLGSFLLPVVVIVGGWSLFNQITVGYFGVTTLTGYNLTNRSGSLIQFVSDEDATIRDIYLKYEALNVQREGTYTMTIWKAIPEMMATTHMSYSALSKRLTWMSIKLFVQHPLLSMSSYLYAWVDFWKVAMRWEPEKLRGATLEPLLKILWYVERRCLVVLNIAYLIIVGSIVYRFFRNGVKDVALSAFVLLIPFVASLAQAVFEYGDNARYAIPFQPLILFSTTSYLFAHRESIRHRVSALFLPSFRRQSNPDNKLY